MQWPETLKRTIKHHKCIIKVVYCAIYVSLLKSYDRFCQILSSCPIKSKLSNLIHASSHAGLLWHEHANDDRTFIFWLIVPLTLIYHVFIEDFMREKPVRFIFSWWSLPVCSVTFLCWIHSLKWHLNVSDPVLLEENQQPWCHMQIFLCSNGKNIITNLRNKKHRGHSTE